MARLILDSGGVIAITRGDARAAAALRMAVERGEDVIVPPVVVTETLRGGSRDAPVNRLLRVARVPFVGARLGRGAGALLGASGLTDAADAQVMAEALRSGPAVLLTSDPGDMARLGADGRRVRVVTV